MSASDQAAPDRNQEFF
jgi:HPt (histidine-containing phosphotransfer) domain-containing protein